MNRTAGAATATFAALVASLAMEASAVGQELSLRREVPSATVTCAPDANPETGVVTQADRQEAARLSSAATQAAIVGDHRGARDLLLRASRLDPSAADVTYLLGRSYEELGDTAAAIRQYCRYLALESSGADAGEVQGRLAALGASDEPELPDEASRQFRMGVVNFDLDRLVTAEQAFARVVEVAPEFAFGHYNLGVTLVAAGRNEAAANSFERFLELVPESDDREVLVSAVEALRNPPKLYNPGAAMATSLILPGVGQFYSGRPVAGFFFLSAVAGSVAFGYLAEDVRIECRVAPVGGVCPPNDIVSEQRERPYLTAALGAAGALALIAAIDAYRGASGKNRAAGTGVTVAFHDGPSGRLGLPALALDRRGAVSVGLLRLEF